MQLPFRALAVGVAVSVGAAAIERFGKAPCEMASSQGDASTGEGGGSADGYAPTGEDAASVDASGTNGGDESGDDATIADVSVGTTFSDGGGAGDATLSEDAAGFGGSTSGSGSGLGASSGSSSGAGSASGQKRGTNSTGYAFQGEDDVQDASRSRPRSNRCCPPAPGTVSTVRRDTRPRRFASELRARNEAVDTVATHRGRPGRAHEAPRRPPPRGTKARAASTSRGRSAVHRFDAVTRIQRSCVAPFPERFARRPVWAFRRRRESLRGSMCRQ